MVLLSVLKVSIVKETLRKSLSVFGMSAIFFFIKMSTRVTFCGKVSVDDSTGTCCWTMEAVSFFFFRK